MAAPIFNHLGKITAAVSVSGATMRMTEDRIDFLKEKVMGICRHISARLGYPG